MTQDAIPGIRSLAVAMIVAGGCAFATAAMAADSGPTKNQFYRAGQWKDVQVLYTKICANCHETGVGPVIKDREDLAPEYYQLMVRNGNKAMPAFRITDIDTPTLVALSQKLSKMPGAGGGK